jgi:hypothetical protein
MGQCHRKALLVALWLPLASCGGETADALEEEVTVAASESAAPESTTAEGNGLSRF